MGHRHAFYFLSKSCNVFPSSLPLDCKVPNEPLQIKIIYLDTSP